MHSIKLRTLYVLYYVCIMYMFSIIYMYMYYILFVVTLQAKRLNQKKIASDSDQLLDTTGLEDLPGSPRHKPLEPEAVNSSSSHQVSRYLPDTERHSRIWSP